MDLFARAPLSECACVFCVFTKIDFGFIATTQYTKYALCTAVKLFVNARSTPSKFYGVYPYIFTVYMIFGMSLFPLFGWLVVCHVTCSSLFHFLYLSLSNFATLFHCPFSFSVLHSIYRSNCHCLCRSNSVLLFGCELSVS